MRERLFTLNDIDYARPPGPVVAVCIDGGDPAYFEAAARAGAIPNVERFMREGYYAIADGTVPSFTCPNNMSIVTGAEPDVHGISGNFYLDPRTGRPVVMTGPELLRSSSILAEYARRGYRVISITAKDKLRQQLQKGIPIGSGNVSFSSQCAGHCTLAENGIEDVPAFVGMPVPDMYSAELSLFVLEAGLRLFERDRPDIMYLSLTDYVQHKHAPEEPEAIDFYRRIDGYFGRLAALGATLALTADHGMNDKARADGTPNVVWLQDVLDAALGRGATRVVCPITDPFVAHHGALGGFVRVYCATAADAPRVLDIARGLPGVESAWTRREAARRFSLPEDREGDVAVISDAASCIGAAQRDHDLSGLAGHRLRTHGGVAEARVPIVLSRPLDPAFQARVAGRRLRSHQLFDLLLHGTVQ